LYLDPKSSFPPGGDQPAATDPVRTAVRFPLHLHLRLETAFGPLDATTENVSASGLLFTTSEPLEPNSRIEFSMAMPAAIIGSATDIAVQCTGRIVRHQQLGGEFHTAAVIDEYVFRA
jgi:hypothetical protein